jgi:methylated-DNA-[protein]-cysteine S-methyltransferase
MRHTLIFDTAFGRCALAWHDAGLTAVRLPDEDHHLRASLARQAPTAQPWPEDEALPSWVEGAVADIRRLLAGEPQDLKHIPVDWRATGEFERRVYAATQALAPGHTCTYGELARDINEPAGMRAVGHALGANPWPLVVPCHRVTAAGGKLGGFSAPGGNETKRQLLVLEAGMVRREGELF